MGVFQAITNSIKSFSKNCFDEMKNRSPKYTKVLSQLKIDARKTANIAGSIRNYFGKEIEECMQDREGYFLQMNSMAKETAENTYAYLRYGTSMEEHRQEGEEVKNGSDNRKGNNDYDIGEW